MKKILNVLPFSNENNINFPLSIKSVENLQSSNQSSKEIQENSLIVKLN